MIWSTRAARVLLVLLSVFAIAIAGCGGGSAATNGGGGSTATNGGGKATTPANGGNTSGGTVDVKSAANNLDKINSYKFKMEMAGGMFDSMAGGLGGDTTGGIVVEGTIIAKPQKAADVTLMGMHVIEVGGKTYTNLLGQWTSEDSTGSSLADDWAPEKMFGTYSSYGWKNAGEGTKNGVACIHYTVSASDMAAYSSLLGVTGADDWTVETWIAKNGGYPVNMTMTAKQSADKYAFKFIMDITNINDPANKVVAPA